MAPSTRPEVWVRPTTLLDDGVLPGLYDVVAVLEAPNDESASVFLEVGSLGNVRTTTLRAYDREAMSEIL